MIHIDYKDKRPLYIQIIEKITHLITLKVLPPGTQLPSVRHLAQELSMNPNTVQKAYTEMEREGIIYTVRGIGSFVGDNQEAVRERLVNKWRSEFEELIRAGIDLGLTSEELQCIWNDLISLAQREDESK